MEQLIIFISKFQGSDPKVHRGLPIHGTDTSVLTIDDCGIEQYTVNCQHYLALRLVGNLIQNSFVVLPHDEKQQL